MNFAGAAARSPRTSKSDDSKETSRTLSIVGQGFGMFATKRRFPRVHGPFFGYYETPQTPVLVYDLNLGGGFVNFGGEHNAAVAFGLGVALPNEGVINVHAETVYRNESGVAVRFVNMDVDTIARLARIVGGPADQPMTH